jgi:cyclophilin family peptidyl-prolyl cis-trans isomerase
MIHRNCSRRSPWLAALISTATLVPQFSGATIVEFQTVMGNFEVNLYDNDTPETVTNFLAYVNNGAYSNVVFHRSAASFVVQGGGFTFDTALPLIGVPPNPAVTNEPEFSNVRGTIAMAKSPGDPDSATNQWFFNLGNNSGNLDSQNGGFTAFGEVTGNGMDVVDAIAALPTFAFGGAFDELPLQIYTATDFGNGLDPDDRHLIIVTAIIVTDTTVNSAAGLNPARNTSNSGGNPPPTGGGGGGGATDLWMILLLLSMVLRSAEIRFRS